MKIFEKIKKWWYNYLARIEKSNNELFDDGEADCCKLNKKQNK